MGIFEIIIIVCAAIIFIILVRRFPDTADNASKQKSGSKSKFHFDLPRVPKVSVPTMPKIELNKFWHRSNLKTESPDIINEDAKSLSQLPLSPAQSEPGTSPDYLQDLSPHLRQILSDANKYYETSQTDLAEKLYIKAAAEEPTCVLAYHRLGTIYMDRKDGLADADDAFLQALKYEPDNGYIFNCLGLVAYQKGLFHESVSYFEKALGADGNIAARHVNIGMAYLSSRQYAKAVRHFSRAWSLEPDNERTKELLDDAKDRERRQRASRS